MGNDMKKICFKQLLFLVAVSSFFLLDSCSERDKFQYYRERANVEENTPGFDPEYHKDTSRRHAAIHFKISQDGTMQIADSTPQIRSGNMPFRPMKSGDFLIIYSNTNGIELGRHAIKDPRNLRASDSTGMPAVIRPTIGITAELLFPYDTTIKRITFYPTVEDTMGFDIHW
jgi:hypothetical protein